MLKITDKLTQVRNSIQVVAQSCHRNPSEITLLAVSKRQEPEAIEEAFTAGQRDFGENYLQEAIEKVNKLKHLDIDWHFIGQIQSNKTRTIAENFSWVHTVEKLKIAKRLSEQRPLEKTPIKVCIQVNIDAAETKGGCKPEDVVELAKNIEALPQVELRGLMAIPDPQNAKHAFANLKTLFDQANQALQTPMDTLSMGMSSDMNDAIEAGSTCVRIGTAIFGPRKN